MRLKKVMTFLRTGKTGRVLLGFGSIALVTAGVLLWFRSDRDLAPATVAPDPIPVIATSVQQHDVPIVLTGLGTVAALNTATIHSLEFVSGLMNPSGNSQALGQVNGALGETIGSMLDGKKTAIGAIGALLTAWLSSVPSLPPGTTPSGLLGLIQLIAGSVPGLSGFTMPLFLALTAWGVLGKLEKWAQGTAPPPTSTK
jgi:hypothetical protein